MKDKPFFPVPPSPKRVIVFCDYEYNMKVKKM